MKRSLLLQASASPRIKPLFLSVMLVATPGLAVAQFKCVDQAGNITLTDLACPGRNVRGPQQTVDKFSPASTKNDMQQIIGSSKSSSISAQKNNVPAKPQPPDSANDKPSVRKSASPA